MNDNRGCLRVVFAVNIALLCCCANHPEQKGVPPILESQKEEKTLDPSIAELKRLYAAAQSQDERRAVSLRAIDEDAIHEGRPISSVDAIFGTHFGSSLPVGKGATETVVIYFGPKVAPPPRRDGAVVAVGYIGWSMEVEYDNEGKIQNYSLNNLWKRHPSYEEDVKERTSIPELRRLYEAAPSEFERRAVCLRAIDQGAITTFIKVATIDQLLGSHLASELPRKGERRTARIDFALPIPSSNQNRDSAGSTTWFLAVEYMADGQIRNYYLTNIHK